MRPDILLTLGLTIGLVAAAPAPHQREWWKHGGHSKTLSTTRTRRPGFPYGTAPASTPTSFTKSAHPTTLQPTPTSTEPDPEETEDPEVTEGPSDGEPTPTGGSDDDGSSAPAPTGGEPGGSDGDESSVPAPTSGSGGASTSVVSAAPQPTSGPAGSGSYWKPKVGDSWQIVLSSQIDPSKGLSPDVTAYDIDMETTPAETIQALKSKGKRVICYFSAGSSEEGRPDNGALQAYKGSGLEGWPGENWLDIRQQGVRDVMKARIARAAQKGCDAVDPDNVDGYGNSNGLGLTEADAIDYIKFLSSEATAKGMSIGLKNAGDIIDGVLGSVHFSVNEQCNAFNECNVYSKFIQAGKPVFNIEYADNNSGRRLRRRHTGIQRASLTRRAQLASSRSAGSFSKRAACAPLPGFSSIIKTMSLDGWVELCDGKQVSTATASK